MSWLVILSDAHLHGVLDIRQEMLDLATFALLPDSTEQGVRHTIEHLASENTLVFQYPKGVSKVVSSSM
jgi:hypothetical protein